VVRPRATRVTPAALPRVRVPVPRAAEKRRVVTGTRAAKRPARSTPRWPTAVYQARKAMAVTMMAR
jgi:hypothetical protein